MDWDGRWDGEQEGEEGRNQEDILLVTHQSLLGGQGGSGGGLPPWSSSS